MHAFYGGPHKDRNTSMCPWKMSRSAFFPHSGHFSVSCDSPLFSRCWWVQLADTHLLEPQRVCQPPGGLRLRVHVRSRLQRRLPAGQGTQTQRRGLEAQLRPLCYLLLQGRECLDTLPTSVRLLHCNRLNRLVSMGTVGKPSLSPAAKLRVHIFFFLSFWKRNEQDAGTQTETTALYWALLMTFVPTQRANPRPSRPGRH